MIIVKVLLILLVSLVAAADFKVPALTGPVVDTAGVINPQDARTISDIAIALNEKAVAQLTVVTLPSLEGNSIEQIGIQIADQWKLGGQKTDNGLILIAAIQERKIRIEVGQGLEGTIPDIIAKRIIEDEIVPMARAGGISKGLTAGVEKIYYSLVDPGSAQAQPTYAGRKKRSTGGFGNLLFLILIIVFGILSFVGRILGLAQVILAEVDLAAASEDRAAVVLVVAAGAVAAADSVAAEHRVAGDMTTNNQNKYPKWILNFLNEHEIHDVSHYVTEQEHRTSGEIVTVIARRSSNTGHVTRTLFLLFLLLAVLMNVRELISYEIHYLLGGLGYSAGVYSTIGSLSFIALICGLYGIAEYIENFNCAQRIFVNFQDQKSQVMNRAMLEFYLNGVTHTEKKTGILIFVSLMERQTVVLADEAIAEKLDSKVWEDIVSTITTSVKQKKTSAGLKSAIHKCGDILAAHFPAQLSNKNELSNHLIIKE